MIIGQPQGRTVDHSRKHQDILYVVDRRRKIKYIQHIDQTTIELFEFIRRPMSLGAVVAGRTNRGK